MKRTLGTATANAGQPVIRGAVVAVNVGQVRQMKGHNRIVNTGFIKRPVSGRVKLDWINFEGDDQADRVNHGGPDKAVYAYPVEHYELWRSYLGALPERFGVFGENLTISGITEDDVCIGDVLEVGDTRLQVARQRTPCFKLSARFDRPTFEDEFVHANRVGFYLRVLRRGSIAAGDSITLIERLDHASTVAEQSRAASLSGPGDVVAVDAAARAPSVLPYLRRRLAARADALSAGRPVPGWPGLREFRVTRRRPEATKIVGLTLRPVDGGPLPTFLPGQFVAVHRSRHDESPGAFRCYSLTHVPDGHQLRVAVKRTPEPTRGGPNPSGQVLDGAAGGAGEQDPAIAEANDVPNGTPGASGASGLSAWLHDSIQVGDSLYLRAPAGSFTPDPDSRRPLVLVAGGIGITPIRSITESLSRAETRRPTTVHYTMRSPDEGAFVDDLLSFAARAPHVDVRIRHTQASTSPTPGTTQARTGRLTVADLLDRHTADDVEVYLCGPEAMCSELSNELVQAGVPADRIRAEAFSASSLTGTLPAPATPFTAEGYSILFRGSATSARSTAASTTILAAAEEAGVRIDSMCRSGSCGSCEVPVTEGSVRYLRQPSAVPAEGHVFACVAAPESDLIIDA